MDARNISSGKSSYGETKVPSHACLYIKVANIFGTYWHIDNFAAFGDRTLFAKVVTAEKWIALRDAVTSAVLKAAPGCTKKDARPFQPHISVSNRDIPAGVMTDALQVMSELNLVEDFPVDNITIFERQNGKWVSAVELELPMCNS